MNCPTHKELRLWLKDFGKAIVNFWNTERLIAIVLLALIPLIYVGLNWIINSVLDWVAMILPSLIFGIVLMALLLMGGIVGLMLMNVLVKIQRVREE